MRIFEMFNNKLYLNYVFIRRTILFQILTTGCNFKIALDKLK